MSTPNPSAPRPAQILVVDDEPDLRTLYELTLLREGYRVEAAGSVAEASQHLDAGRPRFGGASCPRHGRYGNAASAT